MLFARCCLSSCPGMRAIESGVNPSAHDERKPPVVGFRILVKCIMKLMGVYETFKPKIISM